MQLSTVVADIIFDRVHLNKLNQCILEELHYRLWTVPCVKFPSTVQFSKADMMQLIRVAEDIRVVCLIMFHSTGDTVFTMHSWENCMC
jgi:hypothetical protein